MDGRVERGNATRRLVLGRAADIASVEGLQGLSLGRLASDLRLSKSGVFALFGSKEELQLATVRAAIAVYLDHVVRPVRAVPEGIGRVWALCESWLEYSRTRVFPGGCFFFAAAAEFDALTGPLRDVVADAQSSWTAYVQDALDKAVGAQQITADADTGLLAFELIALLEAANGVSLLHHDAQAYTRARVAIANRLRAVAVDPSLVPEPAPGGRGDP